MLCHPDVLTQVSVLGDPHAHPTLLLTKWMPFQPLQGPDWLVSQHVAPPGNMAAMQVGR